MTERDRYIVFDVETPNQLNDRISAIGIVVVENKKVISDFYSLVNPESCFDDRNIQLTGITPQQVISSPTFAQLWPSIKPIMESGLLVAHNASFDISVLKKCITAYGLDSLTDPQYVCTCQLSRKFISDVPNYKLNTLCDHLHIPLNVHHCALDDAHACASLLIDLLKRDAKPFGHAITSAPIRKATANKSPLCALKDLLKSVSTDGVLSIEEVDMLQNWLAANRSLERQYPYDHIIAALKQATLDGIIDSNETTTLLSLFDEIVDPINHACHCNNFSITGKTFCLTGDFNFGSRTEVESWLVNHGGQASKNVTKKLDYLIVGSKGSDQWLAGNYGTKVQKAMKYNESGSLIQIIKEDEVDFA